MKTNKRQRQKQKQKQDGKMVRASLVGKQFARSRNDGCCCCWTSISSANYYVH